MNDQSANMVLVGGGNMRPMQGGVGSASYPYFYSSSLTQEQVVKNVFQTYVFHYTKPRGLASIY